MRKSIPALRQAGYESVSDLPRIQQSYREKALVVILPVMRYMYVQRRTASKEFRCSSDSGSERTVTETVTAYATVH